MRFGLIGYGLFGRHHAACMAATAGVTLAGIAVPSAASRRAAEAEHPGVRVVADWRELVAAADIDAIDVVAPNHLHAEMAIAALEAGKPVLVEKPLATTLEDCERVLAAVGRTGGLLSVGHELRLSAQWGSVKRLIEAGRIGRPAYANLSLFRHPYRQGNGGWRYDGQRVGSWILEEPVHFFDLVMWYFAGLGAPVAVDARGTSAGAAGAYDNFSARLAFADGAYATITQSLAGFGHHLLLEIAGSEGAIRGWWSAANARSPEATFGLEIGPRGGEPEAVPIERSGELHELALEIELTAAAFRDGRVLVPAEVGAQAVIVCLEAERALREGRGVALG
jgi:myo-inositol 2-dehydrogenase/D-chiro-inositol 1-dehydrogenase